MSALYPAHPSRENAKTGGVGLFTVRAE